MEIIVQKESDLYEFVRKETYNNFTCALYKKGREYLVMSDYYTGPITVRVIKDIATELVKE